MFDKNARNNIEKMGLNCLFIDENNRAKKLVELDYLDREKFAFNEKVKYSLLYSSELFQDFNISFYGFPILILDPRNWHEIYIDIINKYQVQSLIFSVYLTGFLKNQTKKKKKLIDISFLKQAPSLKQFYIQPQKEIILSEFWDIEDFTPLEYLCNLEYLSISNNETFIDINFSKLSQLKEVDLQYPIEDKTIYQCEHLETVNIRYYEKSLDAIKNWKKLKYFSAYCDNLESLEGLHSFSQLQIFKPEITAKFKTFKGTNSKSIIKLHVYTEAKKTLKTLDGISGLEVLEDIALNGFRQMESIGDLFKCSSLKELTFENCKIPNDISALDSLANLEKLVFNDCKNIESLEFVKKLPKLIYLSFNGNTKIMDGNLDFLKKMSESGTEIYFNDRKHYSIKYKDLDR